MSADERQCSVFYRVHVHVCSYRTNFSGHRPESYLYVAQTSDVHPELSGKAIIYYLP